MSHVNHCIYAINNGSTYLQDPIPLPPKSDDLHIKINGYEDVVEPKFDPEIHLDLHKPKFVRLFPDFRKSSETPKVNGKEGSNFAYSSPFQVCLI